MAERRSMNKTTQFGKIMCFVVVTYSLGFWEHIMLAWERGAKVRLKKEARGARLGRDLDDTLRRYRLK